MSYPVYDKSFYIDSNHTSFQKKNHLFSKTQILYNSRNLNISVALYGWKTFKLETEHCSQVGHHQLGKRKENVQFQIWVMIYLPFLHMGGKNNKSQRVQKPRWATLDGNLTLPKTENYAEKPWFSKLTSEEITLGLRTWSNIWCMTVGDSKTVLQNN